MESGRKPTRRYGVSCLICRRKKIRCCGEKPTCANCAKSGIACRYKSPDSVPSSVYDELQRSQARAQELEETIRRLALLNHDDRDKLLFQLAGGLSPPSNTSPDGSALNQAGPDSRRASLETESGARQEDLEQAELSIDEHGELQYFGATSRFHQDPESEDAKPETGLLNADQGVDEEYHKRWLLSNARFRASWEKQAHAKLALDPDISADTAMELLQIYWTWQGPLHSCVYRPCFYRDMALDGPYFSPFLLNVLYAHACRHTRVDDPRFSRYGQGDYFLAKAKRLLLDEFDLPKPRVPTIQGLLILGGRQCAVGRHSEGWLYTGIAIRMLKDLGLHLHNASNPLLSRLEPDDLEATKRLCLSAYAWDKSISLCLGRRPCLSEMPFHPSSMLDSVGDDDIWRPLFLPSVEKSYPETRSYTTLTFSWFCRLSMLVHEIYNTVYSGRLNDLRVQAVLDLEKRLRSFYKSIPDALRADDIASASFCPPPHILCLNILYHTLLILLFRPFFPWSSNPKLRHHDLAIRARTVCVREAILVNDFFRAHGETFNFQKQSYLISYCVYTAATIEIQQVSGSDEAAAAKATDRLRTILSMLETEAKQTPGIRRSVDIIKTRLESADRGTRGTHGKPHDALVGTSAPEQEARSSTPRFFRPSASATYTCTSEALSVRQAPEMLPSDVSGGHGGPQMILSQPVDQGQANGWISHHDAGAEMAELGRWMEWGGIGFGGGFVPDTETFVFYEDLWCPDGRIS